MGDGEVKFSSLSGFMQGILILLAILGAVVPTTLGFVNFDKRLDINEEKTDTHIVKDERKWESIDIEMKETNEKLHATQLQLATTEAHYQEIMRSLSAVAKQIDNLERAD